MRNIPVSAAKDVAKKYGYDQVMIYARKVGNDGGEHMTTYGVNKEHCAAIGKIGNYLKHKIMKWPEE